VTVDKEDIERKLDAEWQALREVVESLSDDELLEPGVVEVWSVKDLLGHMAFWADKAAADLAKVAAGHPDEIETPGGETATNEWNARESEARTLRSISEVRSEWQRSFEASKAALEAVQPEQLEIEVKGWDMHTRFAEDTYRHYREHAAQIRAWKREVETTEE